MKRNVLIAMTICILLITPLFGRGRVKALLMHRLASGGH